MFLARVLTYIGLLPALAGLVALAIIALDGLGVSVPEALQFQLLISWGFLLYSSGVREPWVDAGGGFAWLTVAGVFLVYLLPAGVLLGLAWLLRRKVSEGPIEGI